MSSARRRLLVLGSPALVVLLVAGFLWFRPDTLFVDRTVDDQVAEEVAAAVDAAPRPTPTSSSDPTPLASPTAETAPSPDGPRVLGRGEWTSLEHETTGSVALVEDDGDLQLVLDELATSNGPDLRVILSPKVGVPGDWFGYDAGSIELGPLKGNLGTQVYDVPDDLDLDAIASVVIWCERFSVGFGAANLA